MSSKSIIMFGMVVGSMIGSFIPAIWGGDLLSFSSIIFSTIGGLVGIYLGFKVSR